MQAIPFGAACKTGDAVLCAKEDAMQDRKPFFPSDKPRSWIIGISAAILGLLFGSLGFLGYYTGLVVLFDLGRFGVAVCAITGFLMGVIVTGKNMLGMYKNFRPSSWKDRPW